MQVPPWSLTTAERPQAGSAQPGKVAPDGHNHHGVHQRREPAAENHPRFTRYGPAVGHPELGAEGAVLCQGRLSFSPVIRVYTDGDRSPRHTSLKYLGLRCPPRVRLEEPAWLSSQTLWRQCVDEIRCPFCLIIVCLYTHRWAVLGSAPL